MQCGTLSYCERLEGATKACVMRWHIRDNDGHGRAHRWDFFSLHTHVQSRTHRHTLTNVHVITHAHIHTYYRSRIKCLLFVPKTQTPRVTSKSPHTILKKQKIWVTFLFLIFSMVWAPLLTMQHTRLSWILGMKSRHFILLRYSKNTSPNRKGILIWIYLHKSKWQKCCLLLQQQLCSELVSHPIIACWQRNY